MHKKIQRKNCSQLHVMKFYVFVSHWFSKILHEECLKELLKQTFLDLKFYVIECDT